MPPPWFPAGRPAVIAMVHVGALPGTPLGGGQPWEETVEQAVIEALICRQAGADAVLLENMHDRPYLRGAVGPEITACMTRIGSAVRAACGLPCGLQILAGANAEALAAACAAGLQFVRVEGFVFGHVADEGWMDGCAGPLLRYRRALGAGSIAVFADIKKKHASHAVTGDISLAETAQAAEFFLSDGVVVTGKVTGDPPPPADLRAVRETVSIPVLAGSGVTLCNAAELAAHADALIAGSSIKRDGRWENPVDPDRLSALVEAVSCPSRTAAY